MLTGAIFSVVQMNNTDTIIFQSTYHPLFITTSHSNSMDKLISPLTPERFSRRNNTGMARSSVRPHKQQQEKNLQNSSRESIVIGFSHKTNRDFALHCSAAGFFSTLSLLLLEQFISVCKSHKP